jgi:ABC-type branched-subunit amino acid transport system substrate-binding protein
MMSWKQGTGRLAVLAVVVGLVAVACSSGGSDGDAAAPAGGAATGRGFDGTTITVAGIGPLTSYSGADVGAQARFKRANDTGELKGVKIAFAEFVDDKSDPAIANAEMRRLVTQKKVFAVVPDFSSLNPGPYLAAQKVPYVGYALDNTICSDKPSTSLWGFGFNGCLVPTKPKVMPDFFSAMHRYVVGKTGKKHPTAAIGASDVAAGKTTSVAYSSTAAGAGFEVVYHRADVPSVTSDFAPYVQEWMHADGGKQPDIFMSFLPPGQAISALAAMRSAGFKGTFFTPFGVVDPLAKALAGTVTMTSYNVEPNPGLKQMTADLDAFKAGTKPISYSNVPAYFAADKFVEAVKSVQAAGKDITPEAVRAALSTQKWEIKGLVGPFNYPESSVAPSPNCIALMQARDDGSGYTTLAPYTCSSKQYPVDPKFAG